MRTLEQVEAELKEKFKEQDIAVSEYEMASRVRQKTKILKCRKIYSEIKKLCAERDQIRKAGGNNNDVHKV